MKATVRERAYHRNGVSNVLIVCVVILMVVHIIGKSGGDGLLNQWFVSLL